jgi:hypothetical protein
MCRRSVIATDAASPAEDAGKGSRQQAPKESSLKDTPVPTETAKSDDLDNDDDDDMEETEEERGEPESTTSHECLPRVSWEMRVVLALRILTMLGMMGVQRG